MSGPGEARMKIATFNINGIKARAKALLDWLDEARPDVALLQEIKCVDEAFPREPFEERGYNVETHGQKGFNGVAILSRPPLEDVVRGLPDGGDDVQARWIEATVAGRRALRVCCLYLPNGNPAPGPKYDYKLAWMARLEDRARALLADEFVVQILQPEDNRQTSPRLQVQASRDDTPRIVQQLTQHDIAIYSLKRTQRTLESYFLEVTGSAESADTAEEVTS